MASAAALVVGMTWAAPTLHAQQWRGRVYTRLQYVEARPIVLDSVPIGLAVGGGDRRQVGDTTVRCAPGATHCFFYRPGTVESTAPVIQDLDLNVWGFGVQGLRVYLSARTRAALGSTDFWPRTNDHFDLLAGYAELVREHYRLRLGRDYQVSGLGFYGYDGGSAELRLRPARLELEAYGGWGLARGLPEPVSSDALASLEEFQPRKRNLLFGFRAAGQPFVGASFEAIYQREIATDRSGIASERLGLDATYSPVDDLWLKGHADYDVATGWWGKAGTTIGWSPIAPLYVEGRLFRYRPVFSLQTIWVVFSPAPYHGWGLALGVRPDPRLSVRLEAERRRYGDTEAEVPFFNVTDRTWRAGVSAQYQSGSWWDVRGGYWLDWGFGAGLSSTEFRAGVHPIDRLTLGARFSAFQQVDEFRVGEGRVWSLGGDVEWRGDFGTLYASLDRYRHDRRGGGAVAVDWSQTRASLGLSLYLGSEPGRAR